MQTEATYELAAEADRLNAIYHFVRAHGFEAKITNVVTVTIPWHDNCGNTGFETFVVRNMSEARKVLGY